MINFAIEHGDWFFCTVYTGELETLCQNLQAQIQPMHFLEEPAFFFNVPNTLQLLVNLLKMYEL